MGVDALNWSGGLFVAWFSSSMLVKIVDCTKNFILCNVMDGPYFYYLCFLYGAPRIGNREDAWEALNEKLMNCQGPLIILGDFNQVEFADQKSGGSSYLHGAKKFTEWRIGNGLSELPSHGPAFTWCNSRRGGELIYEHLDRAYCNEDRRNMRKQESVAKECRSWCLERKKKLGITWDLFIEELRPLQTATKVKQHGDSEVVKRQECQEKAKSQHLYWRQRAKVSWDRMGDQCTNFFFRSVKTKKGRNWINSKGKVEARSFGKMCKTHVARVWEENRKTSILEDIWAGCSLVNFKRNALRGQEETPKVVNDLMRGQAWNAAKVWHWFNKNDAQRILSTYVPQQEKEDETIWLHKENGDYSVKSGYWFIQNGSQRKDDCSKFWKLLWKAQMSQRWRNFCWKLAHNVLPTRDNLVKRGMEVNQECGFCGEKETTDHLFINCEVTKRVWNSSTLGLRSPSCSSLDTSSWFKNMFVYLHKISDSHHQVWPSYMATLWAIWIHRNNITFRKEKANPKEIMRLAEAETERWSNGFGANTKNAPMSPQNSPNDKASTSWEWGIIDQRENILIIDGAWKQTKKEEIRAAFGWIMEQRGGCVDKKANRMFAASPLQAEAYAMLEGSASAAREWTTVTIWTDSARMIQMLHNPKSAPNNCYLLILDILDRLKAFTACSVQKVGRSYVRKAHDLAIQARQGL
ncbi:hypothetical protein RDABS01_035066 [Bienertia sinuspersici]